MNWPDAKRAAVSLTFDDARSSQVTNGLQILDAHRIPATFYVTIGAMRQQLDAWQAALARGHEIGNHTLTHPCSGNYLWTRDNALEDMTVEEMEFELDESNRVIRELLGATPTTFAYPCGQKFIGRGEGTRSYVPLVARRFLAGRGYRDESLNNPQVCDLAQLAGVHGDGLSFDELKRWVDRAVEEGAWLALAMHEVGEPSVQSIERGTLQQLCAHLSQRGDLWTAPVAAVASYVKQQQVICRLV